MAMMYITEDDVGKWFVTRTGDIVKVTSVAPFEYGQHWRVRTAHATYTTQGAWFKDGITEHEADIVRPLGGADVVDLLRVVTGDDDIMQWLGPYDDYREEKMGLPRVFNESGEIKL